MPAQIGAHRARALTGNLLLILNPLLYVTAEGVSAAAWHHPAYRYGFNAISDLGVPSCGDLAGHPVCSPRHPVMNAAFITHGALVALAAILLAPCWLPDLSPARLGPQRIRDDDPRPVPARGERCRGNGSQVGPVLTPEASRDVIHCAHHTEGTLLRLRHHRRLRRRRRAPRAGRDRAHPSGRPDPPPRGPHLASPLTSACGDPTRC